MATASVLGASGYLGGELLRILLQHPSLTVSHAVSRSHPGRRIHELWPNLPESTGLTTEPSAARVDSDVAFLAEPAGEAMRIVPDLLDRGIKVVDLGPDYRLRDSGAYEAAYGRPHRDAGHLDEAVYGIPELFEPAIRSARLVANPGCYPTAALLALAPLLRAGAIEGPIVVDAKSGSSGAGAAPTAATHHPEVATTVLPYGVPTHRHLPEIRQGVCALRGGDLPIVFVPHLVPLVRGLLCTIYPRAVPGDNAGTWDATIRDAYAGRPFVRVGGVPRLPWATGTNVCYLSVQPVDGTAVLLSALDNLGKGGAGQAVQNANLLFGWDERLGLARGGFGV